MKGGSDGIEAGPRAQAVSFPGEELIVVDGSDRLQGFGTKEQLHAGNGRLHRAFSVFLLDRRGRVLLHRRSDQKPLWPGYWTNSCCSHPRRGEQLQGAVKRRLREELGVRAASLEQVYSFEYHARFGTVGSEHEFCHVFLARLPDAASLRVNPSEIAEWAWRTPEAVDAMVAGSRDGLTPWFCLEWEALRGLYRRQFEHFAASPRSAA